MAMSLCRAISVAATGAAGDVGPGAGRHRPSRPALEREHVGRHRRSPAKRPASIDGVLPGATGTGARAHGWQRTAPGANGRKRLEAANPTERRPVTRLLHIRVSQWHPPRLALA